VLGSVNVDLVVTAEFLPAPGETVAGGTFAMHHGGKGANQAVAAARLGASVSFVGAVGDDEFGVSARDMLVREGIAVDGLATLARAATGVALIAVDRRGENQITVASGANLAYGAEIWDSAAADADVFLAGFEVGDDAVVAGAVKARAAGAVVLINPAPARDLRAELLGTRPIVVANEGEAAALTGVTEAVAAARAIAARTGAPAVVTLGERGALVTDGQTVQHVPTPRVDVVDTTGAGDTFVGALAAELSIGRPLIDAVRFAVLAASLSVRVAGAREGMPSRAEVERSLGINS
jgi:ribokinase